MLYGRFLLIALFVFASFVIRAQTSLSAGDIAFTGYVSRQSPVADTFSFVVLKSSGFDAGTEIYFTDNGWLPTGAGRAGGEGLLKWTASQHLRYGEQVRVVAGTNITVDKGSIVKISGSFDLSTSGDQLFAYTGTWPSPDLLLAGVHYFKTATTTTVGWDVGTVATGSSELSVYPTGLCSTCGVWVTDPAVTIVKITTAGYYKGGYNASPAALRAMINNNANWSNTFSLTSTAPTWRLPPTIELPAENVDTAVIVQPDTSAPRVIAVTSSMADGVYKAGDEINIIVYFDKNVVVNASAGTPYLQLNVGKDSSKAVYVTGSCGSALTFLYKVQPGDTAARLDYLSTAALKLNSGTIQNAMANAANVTLPSNGATLAAIRSLTINAVAPVITPYQTFTADRYSSNGTVVGAILATTHGPVGTTLRNWSIVQGNAGSAFSVNSATGELVVANESVLHDEAYAGFNLMVTVGDGSNNSAPEEVMVLLREVALDDTLHFAHDSLFENKPAGTVAGRLALASGNAGAVYTLVAGSGDADNSLFAVQRDSLQTTAPLDYEQQREYHIRVRATMQNRYIDTSLVVYVHNLNEPPTIDAVANQTVCENAGYQTLPLTGISCGPEGDECVTVAVSSNNPSLFAQLLVIRESDGATTLRYKVKDSTAGVAVVTITVKDNGGTANGGVDSVTTSFTITAKASGKVTVTASGNTALTDNETVTLTATVTGATGAMQWMRNGDIVADAHTASYKVDVAHAGAYNCTVTSAEGCVASSNTVVVSQANVPVTLMTYPNPTSGKLYIVFTGYVEKYVYAVVHSSAGAELQKKKIWHASETQKDEIDLSSYANGMYLIELLSDKGEKIASANVLKN